MMREIQGVTDEPRTHRRWFHDDEFDLFVWQTESGDVTLFQLCYGVGTNERALVWHRDVGFFHDGTDTRQSASGARRSDVETGKPAAADPVIARFEAAAQALPAKVRRAVGQRVREFLAGRVRVPSRRTRFRREEWQDPAGARPAGETKTRAPAPRPRGR